MGHRIETCGGGNASYREPCGGNGNKPITYTADVDRDESGNITKVYSHGKLTIPCVIGGKCYICGAPLDTAFKCTKCGEQHTVQVYGGGSGGTAK